MGFLLYLGIIILFKQFVDIFFSNKLIYSKSNTHDLFRTFFCFIISTMSCSFSICYWEQLVTNPLDSLYFSNIINNLMFAYMITDTFCLIYPKLNKKHELNIVPIRIELLVHHVICIGLYGLFANKLIMTFCALAEILSAFNWIGILYPQYEWSIKLYRLYSILFIRLFVWGFTMVFLYKYTLTFLFASIGVMIFLLLDCYWAWIIISNFFKYKKFIKNKIVSETKKKFKN